MTYCKQHEDAALFDATQERNASAIDWEAADAAHLAELEAQEMDVPTMTAWPIWNGEAEVVVF